MRTIRHSILALGVAAAAAATLVPGAGAADPVEPTFCEGTIANQVIDGDVFVPYTTSCTLQNVIVRGSVIAEVDAEVVTLDRTAVTGDVVSQGHRLVLDRAAVNGAVSGTEARDGVSITRSVVRGNLRTNNVETALTIGSPTDATRGNVIGGMLTVSGTFGEGTVARNAVAGDLVVRDNFAQVAVRRNVVRGALGCTGNDPAPVGSGNVAASKTGQCAGF
jgi:hypothetical protein